jgi:hypothetical protein
MTRNIARRLLPVVFFAAAINACSGPAVVESSAAAVTVRYGIDQEEGAMQLAQQLCGIRQKTARLRSSANFGLTERYGHFDCI